MNRNKQRSQLKDTSESDWGLLFKTFLRTEMNLTVKQWRKKMLRYLKSIGCSTSATFSRAHCGSSQTTYVRDVRKYRDGRFWYNIKDVKRKYWSRKNVNMNLLDMLIRPMTDRNTAIKYFLICDDCISLPRLLAAIKHLFSSYNKIMYFSLTYKFTRLSKK